MVPSSSIGALTIHMTTHTAVQTDIAYRNSADYLRVLCVGCEMKQSGTFFVDRSVDGLAGTLL